MFSLRHRRQTKDASTRPFIQRARGQIGCALLVGALHATCSSAHADARLNAPAELPAPLPSAPPLETVNGAYVAQRLPRIQYQGGAFLRHPRIVTVTFAGDNSDFVSRLEQFGDRITRTPWWHLVAAGYCVGARDCIGDGQPGLAVQANDVLPPQIRAVDISALLERDARAGRFGPLDWNTLILVYLPPGVNLSDAFARYCGAGPHGFHRALRFDGRSVPYAVIPRCDDEAATTTTASHELLEATTNPDNPHRGFAFVRSEANLGFTAAGLEPVDACGLISRGDVQANARQTNARETEAHRTIAHRTNAHRTMESGFVVQRAWSNIAASRGHDPCVPAATLRPYVALVPAQGAVPLRNAGEHATISLVAAADRPVAEWRVTAIDLASVQGGEPCVEVALDRTQVHPGETVRLTMTRLDQPTQRLCVVGLVSTLDGYSYMWPLAVGQP